MEGFVWQNELYVHWSVMIVLYPYITGLVAGAFVVSALYHVFHQNVLKPVARLSLVTALCFCSCATLPLLLHLHHPERAFNVMITPSPTSAMAGFGFIYNFYMALLVVEVWLVYRPEIIARANSKTGLMGLIYKVLTLGVRQITEKSRKVDEWLIHALTIIGTPSACILHGYVGFLFGGVKANPWWSTALMPIIFLVSAIVSGIAVLIVLYQFICWRRKVAPDADCVRAMSRYLWMSRTLAVTLELLEVIHMAYEGSAEWLIIESLLHDRLAFSYVTVQLILGSVAPFVLLLFTMFRRLNAKLMMTISCVSSLLVLLQVFAMRWNVVIGGQMFSKSFHGGIVNYHLETMGREGLVAAIVVMILPLIALAVACKLLPIWEEDDSPSPIVSDDSSSVAAASA